MRLPLDSRAKEIVEPSGTVAELLDFLDHLGNNGWARNSQADELMPKVPGNCEETGLTVACVTEAMMSIGYGRHALHQLDRWESKRTTGRFGR
jgi:hypothetical protein